MVSLPGNLLSGVRKKVIGRRGGTGSEYECREADLKAPDQFFQDAHNTKYDCVKGAKLLLMF